MKRKCIPTIPFACKMFNILGKEKLCLAIMTDKLSSHRLDLRLRISARFYLWNVEVVPAQVDLLCFVYIVECNRFFFE